MRLIALWYCLLGAAVIRFTILNERIQNPYSSRLAKILLDDAISKYNKSLADLGIEIQIEEFLDYKKYSKRKKFKQIAKLAGHPSIKKRFKALESIDKNIILLVSTMENPQADKFNIIDMCKSRFFFSAYENGGRKSSDDSTPAPVIALNKWLSGVLNTKLPDPFSSEEIDLKFLDKNYIKKKIERCKILNESDEDGEYLVKKRKKNTISSVNQENTSFNKTKRASSILNGSKQSNVLSRAIKPSKKQLSYLNKPENSNISNLTKKFLLPETG